MLSTIAIEIQSQFYSEGLNYLRSRVRSADRRNPPKYSTLTWRQFDCSLVEHAGALRVDHTLLEVLLLRGRSMKKTIRLLALCVYASLFAASLNAWAWQQNYPDGSVRYPHDYKKKYVRIIGVPPRSSGAGGFFSGCL